MPSRCCENQPNAPLPRLQRLERALMCWEFPLPEGHSVGAAHHNALNGFIRNYSCKEKEKENAFEFVPTSKSSKGGDQRYD